MNPSLDPSRATAALRADATTAPILGDVLEGLLATPKTLPPKLFYDARGAALFERICELDEYYLTRTEISILEQNAAEIVSILGKDCTLVELGSGNSVKVAVMSVPPKAALAHGSPTARRSAPCRRPNAEP